ncbi:hypothetical protein [Zavarzinia compransoris]|uniref:Uncharacterized protein n=1 Tax=Zavarzinia compransoris TaxID=1264899 RepID=A0A317EBE5_9PROT|nr:hypothetical protein [Zavarzinia compransoris]PWR23536.1 hypothetical protein DKG75_02890 [Zavarzinia compransoris]
MRDYLGLGLLFALISTGVFFAADWWAGQQDPVQEVPAQEVAVAGPPPAAGNPEPPSPARPGLPRGIRALYGDDGRLLPEIRAAYTRSCERGYEISPEARTLFNRDRVGEVCACMVDWMERAMADGSLSAADMKEYNESSGRISGKLFEKIQEPVKRCIGL